MNSRERYQEVRRLFQAALELESRERDAYLDKECAATPELAAEVRKLLTSDRDESGPIPVSTPRELARGRLHDEVTRRLTEAGPASSRYERRAKIAEGGMGEIWNAWDPVLRRDVAVKIAREESGEAPVDRFLEEAQVTGQLDHPGIVPVHELGIDHTGALFFAMRLVKGRELREIIDEHHDPRPGRSETWPLPRLVSTLQRVCEAVAYAHDKGVVHRDLKPANVMVGRYGEVYVMDWGLARVLGDRATSDASPVAEGRASENVASRERDAVSSDRREETKGLGDSPLATRDGDIMGTPHYMPPEQARGELAGIGPHSDIYAIGALLYHVLVGHAPFADGSRKSHSEILQAVQKGAPRPPVELTPSVPPELDAICQKAMARDPKARFGSVSELAEELRAWLENRVVKSYATGPIAELRKWIQRNRATALTAAASVLAIVGLSVASALIVSAKNRDLVASEARAERRFDDVHDLARSLVIDLEEKLVDVPGAIEARRFIVGEGLAYLDRLADESDDDPELLGDLVQAYRNIAMVQGGFRNSNLGDHAGATASLERARTLFQRLLEIVGSSAKGTHELALIDRDLADLQYQAGDTESAAAVYDDVLKTLDELEQVEHSIQLDVSRVNLLERIGDVQRRRGQSQAALDTWTGALELNEQLRARDADVDGIDLRAHNLHKRIGEAHRDAGAYGVALEHFAPALKGVREQNEREPDSEQARRRLATCLIDVGGVHWELEQTEQALERFGEALTIYDRLVELAPGNAWHRQGLANALERVGDCLSDLGRLDEALPLVERALAERSRLARDVEGDLDVDRGLAVAHEKVGNVLGDLGDFELSVVHYETSLSIREGLLERHPDSAQIRRDRAVAEYKLGLVHSVAAESAGKPPPEARAAWETALEYFGRALDSVRVSESLGMLQASDAHVPAMIEEYIERCESALLALE